MNNIEKDATKLKNKLFYLKMMKLAVINKSMSYAKDEYNILINHLVTWYKLTQ